MSLILEALKKSEAERRAGEVPVLLGERTWTPQRQRPLWPVFVAFVLCVGLAALFANRKLLWPERFGAEPAEPGIAATGPAPEGSLTMAEDEEPAAASAQKPEYLAETPATEPDPAFLPEPPATYSPPPAARPAPVAVAPAEPDLQPAADSVPSIQSEPAPAQPMANVSDPPATFQTPPPNADTPPPAEIASAPDVPTQAPVEAPPPEASVPLFSDLPYATREAMPAIKMSMHVFHQDPSRRFIIVNGSRLQEGGVVGEETHLRGIHPNGAVFEFRGQQFMLQRQGR
ncbi:MAG: general secretion pathway protein GspB [Ahniella sp.]|nr:general secretion pathway protein GspB [Ahniella sp.]